MQHLVVDSYVLHFPRTGVVNYVFHVLEELVRRSEFDLTAMVESNGFADPEVAAFAARSLKTRLVKPYDAPQSARFHREEAALSTRLPSPEEVSRAVMPGEIYHATDWYHYPARHAKKNVLTYYDLTVQVFPDTHEYTNIVKETRKLRAAREFDHIVAISESTRKDLIEHGGISANRITVSYPGSNPIYELASYYTREELLHRYGLADDARYILSVSTIERRKNTIGILRSFALIKQNPSLRHLKLVLSGHMGWKIEDLRQFLDDFPYRDDVIFVGYVPIDDMPSLYRHAEAFVYLSFYEGFGLPILEAMKSRCPVVCSNTSSMPEVIGDCGELVSPSAPEEAAAALARIVEDPVYADILRFGALARSNQFTWAGHVEDLTRIYNLG